MNSCMRTYDFKCTKKFTVEKFISINSFVNSYVETNYFTPVHQFTYEMIHEFMCDQFIFEYLKYGFIYKFIFEKTPCGFMYELIYKIYLIHMYKFMYKCIYEFDQRD